MRIRRDFVQTWLLLLALLLASGTARTQGTMTYLSNLGQVSVGNYAVGSDSWLATEFKTGTNASSYFLDSIQLNMADASGNPDNFLVTLCAAPDTTVGPGNYLATLSGTANPATAGTYTFSSTSNLMLTRTTSYFIVLTAGTMVVNGAYGWSDVGANPGNASGGWLAFGSIWTSSNGSSWSGLSSSVPQFAINATAIPEPSEMALTVLGVSFLSLHRWRRSLRKKRH